MNGSFFQHKEMVKYLGDTLGQGGSRPQIMASEDGVSYVIKFKENDQGKRVLVNELVANGIARHLELPCPEGIIAVISEDFLEISNIRQIYNGNITSGLHFGIQEKKDIYRRPPRSLINQVTNTDNFAGIILFDILTFNNNRNNDGNYLIITSLQPELYIIDHGYCFGSPNWDTSIVNNIGMWNQNILPEMVNFIRGLDPFREFIEKINNISNEFISLIVDEIPSEWTVTPDERIALKTFLWGQRDKIEEIIFNNKSLFPFWE